MKQPVKKMTKKNRLAKTVCSLVCLTAVLAITANSQREGSGFFLGPMNEIEVDSLAVATIDLSEESSSGILLVADQPDPIIFSETVSAPVDIEIIEVSVEEVEIVDPQSSEGYYKAPEPTFLSHLQVGVDYTHVNLKPNGHSSFSGSLGGLQGSYDYTAENHFYIGAKFAWKQGSTSGDTGTRSLLYIDAQEKLGYTLSCDEQHFQMTFFSGLGYRHFGEHLKTNEGDSIQFKYNELYVPVGLMSDYEVVSWVKIGLGVTWMPQVYPTVLITPLKGSRWVLNDTLTNFFVELPVDFTLTSNKRFHLIFNPFYEHWEDGHSTAKTSGGLPLGLPGNTYNFWGADLNFCYCF